MQQLVVGDAKENWAVILEETVERERNYVYVDHKGRADCGCCSRGIISLLRTAEKPKPKVLPLPPNKLENQIHFHDVTLLWITCRLE